MTLRKRTFGLVSLTLAALMAILYVVSRITLSAGFSQLERDGTYREAQRVLGALSTRIDALDTTTWDWAAWDDTYQFIEDANPEYIESNLVDSTFIALQLNLMLFVDASDDIVFGKAFDLQNEEEVSIPQSLRGHVSSDGLLLHHADTESHLAGILSLPEGPLLIAAHPIVTSEDEGPIRGTLIMGRYLDDTEIQRVAESALVSLSSYLVHDPQLPSDFQEVLALLSDESPVHVHELSTEVSAGYALVNDLRGHPLLVFRIDVPRDIYHENERGVNSLLVSLLVVGIGLGVALMFILERSVLSPLSRLRNDVSSIAFGKEFSARVQVAGKDELSVLAISVNEMLSRLEESYNQEHKLRREREAEIKRRGEFTRALVHELRTPLTPILASTSLLMQELQREDLLPLVRNINAGARTLQQRVDELLDLAKGELGLFELERRDMDPLQFLQAVVDAQAPVASSRGQVLNMELPSSLSPAWADENRLHQVVFNLLDNAFKYTPGGGEITLRAREEKDVLIVEVQDTGPGIPVEEQQRLFEPHYRVEPKGRHVSGLGLGLALSKTIVELHGGQIWVRSEVGEGSTFGFSVPHHPGPAHE